MKNIIKGSCHCGAIHIEISGSVYGLKHCHCISCRKLHGTLFASNSIVNAEDFKIVKGSDNFHDYSIRADKIARFCKTCCSPIYAYVPGWPKAVYIRTGILDDDPGVRAAYHWWVSEKAPWYDIHDNLSQFPEAPSESNLAALNAADGRKTKINP